MISKKKIYKKNILTKKMTMIVVYGLIFLISTSAFYFVNNSKAQNVLKLQVSVIDENIKLDYFKYDIKVSEEDGIYKAKFPKIQNGFIVNKYKIITENDFEEYKKRYATEEQTSKNKVEDEEPTEKEMQENEDIKEEQDEEHLKEENSGKIDEKIENTKKTEIEIEAEQEYEFTKEQVENKKIFLAAEYEFKEKDNLTLFNKVISKKEKNNNITISGYMPKDAEISIKEADTSETENTIKENLEKESIKLSIAYDIKILVDKKEYEPKDFDENVQVIITDVNDKNLNIWHIKEDNTVELIKPKVEENTAIFETKDFSVYGVEVLEENTINEETDEKNNEEPKKESINDEENIIMAKAEPSRASDTNILEIDDYNSDYYYYKGKNYTDNLTGTNSNTYTDSNLVRVTINYHGYAQADEANDAMIGRISLESNERQAIVKHIRCLPVLSGNVTIELMDNPFMDKPTGYGFGGWTSSDGTITTNSYTKAQTMSVATSVDLEVNVYTNWTTATVIYLNGASGNDNRDGLTAANAVKTWTSAVSKLSNSNNRETNIIVLCGNMTDGINYQGNSNNNTTNNNYSSANNSKELTITSLYNHTDYRNQATLNLTNATKGTFTIYKDFQMNHVKINATGYTLNNSSSTGINTGYPRLIGLCHNVRIGRGIALADTSAEAAAFTAIVGGNASSSNTDRNAAYKLVVESGKYYTILGYNYNGGSGNSYDGTVYYTLGSDVDRAEGHVNNDNLSVYFRTTINTGSGYNGNTNNEKAFLTNIKSGKFGVDYFARNGDTSGGEGYTSGVYVGGLTTGAASGTTDRASRYCLVEGGEICNIIGGLKLYTSYSSSVKTRIYVKGGEVRNIVGGAGVTTTFGDRMIQITGGNLLYSVSGGSNGVYGGSGDGQITDCDTLVYIGGDAQIGTAETIGTTLYGVQGGCVLGAGNGASGVTGCGQVDNSHIVINDNAHILNSVFGGGNHGVVGNSNGSSATSRIDILGGTIDKNVYGGSNQNNINGTTTINISAGQVKGAVYGGSNQSGNIKSTATVNVTGGTLGTNGNTNPVLFGGGKGLGTSVTGNATVNISDASGTVNIYGSAYGGSEQGAIGGVTTSISYTRSTSITSGNQYIISNGTSTSGYNQSYTMVENGTSVARAALSTANVPSSNIEWIITETQNGYSIKNAESGRYLAYSGGLILQNAEYNTWTFSNNRFSTRVGNSTYYLRYSNNNWTSSTSTSGATIYLLTYNINRNVNSTSSTFVNITDDMTTSNNTVNIVGNVFAGGRGTSSIAAMVTANSTITVDGCNLPSCNIFGGNDINGTTDGNILVKIGENYSSTVVNVYGGGNEDDTGTEADSVRVYLHSHASVTKAFNGGKSADLLSTNANDTTRQIFLQGGHADNIYGGSDTLGTVTVSNVYIQSGTATNVFGGNNEGGQTTTSKVSVTGGTVTNVFGGGYRAATTTSNVSLTGGTITSGFGGGNAANVTTANITLNGTTSTNIFGGSNSSGIVNTSNVTITSGTVTNVYGGNNEGGNTVNTNVAINSSATNVFGGGNRAQTTGNTTVTVTSTVGNVYGGGNEAITSGNTSLTLTNATVTGDAYGGGNGSAAVVVGNSTTKVHGTTVVNGDLFGGGNAAANGTEARKITNPSTVTTLITGGTIRGDVYGAANTSVVYGDTIVKIGSNVVNDNSMTKASIRIGGNANKGTVFGGGKSNTAGSENYDFTFESVTGDANIDIDATGYDNGTHTFEIVRSVFGSGNAAKISGDGYVNIVNYGTSSNVKNNVSIQRATRVTLDNCHMYLVGTTDTTNEIATAVYTFNRIEDLIIKNNTVLYLASGVNIVAKLQSLDSSGNKETVTINSSGIQNGSQNVDNRIYLSQGRTIILKTEAGTDGEVLGMAYIGMFKGTDNREFGIYGDNYVQGSTVSTQVDELFTRNSYVQGKHYTSHNINQDGYFTKYNVEGSIEYKVIIPTPEDAAYYQWIMGKTSTDIYYEDIELIATKYATTATYVLNLAGLSYPNMIIDVIGIDVSDLSNSITLNDPDTIPNIAPTGTDANTKFGLTMTAGNSGWQTRGTTYFLNNNDVQADFDGRDQYLADNSTTTPSFSLYLAHSKNITTTEDLGTVTIQLQATYYENNYDLEPKIKNVYIVLKLTTNDQMVGTDYYEGSITPGKQYNIFPTTTTTITQNSSFSAYYSLYVNNYSTGQYYTGFSGHYYHTIETSCVFPANTKITLVDKSGSTTRYYYYIVSSADANANKKIFRFTDFFAMDSEEEHYSADGSYYNSTTDLLYEEFIVQVDFEDVTLSNNLESKNIVVQLRDIYDVTGNTIRVTVNNALYPMLFSVYNDIDVTKNLTLTTDKNVIYMGATLNLGIETEYSFNKNLNSDVVYDTTHTENALGVRITISSGSDILTSSDLEGIYITYNGSNYFPRSDGSYRIKIADSVANVIANMTLNTENGKLDTGTYTITAQSFGSIDGTYFSTAIASDSKNIQVVSTDYGFVVNLDNNSVLIDKTTGKTKNNTNNLNFTIGYSGEFANPKIVVSLYRRKYDQVYSYEYDEVDLADYVTNNLVSSSNVQNEYLVTNNLTANQNFTLTTKSTGLTTGTYKIVFTLYDGNTIISNMHKSVIIR